ncbi:MAG: MFS transporter [Candidatus Nanopelagicales bacterium]|jgi:EmrB/QacA subfamily drug resistance transporter|nr:MFS transporter [Candidatus Nanopelagicales bacterium]MCF8542688.1 MFS transporter [Candidatus Nanopelagicales bacterium]MCF8558121.1 MFS transporter [Candidatus Nanopelagicales bacterium]
MASASSAPAATTLDPNRWRALIVIAIAQLMVVLDASIVNIALPSIQTDLGMTDANRQWVLTAYTLAFGGLLLLGGRIADFQGRKRMFIVGLIGFAAASFLGGISTTEGMLFAARALQGVFAALLAPAALSLISVTFTESKERARAFGVFGAISGGGAAIGLIAGGILTEYLSWHWTLLVNVPIAILAVFLAIPFVKESRAHGDTKYDIPGAITATLGLVSLVYGITRAESDGWNGSQTLAFMGFGVLLLLVFMVIESRSSHPLLPIRILANRNRGGAYLASFFVGVGLFAMFLFLTYFFQGVMGYTPLTSGLLFLPFSVGIVISAGIASQLLPRFGPRYITTTGFLLAVVGMLLLTRMTPESSYVTDILPALILMSLGMGLIFVPLSAVSLYAVGDHDAGVASAVLNTSQQIGGSIGVAFLNTIAASTTAAFVAANAATGLVQGPDGQPMPSPEALVAGFTRGFLWGAAILVVAGVIWVVLVTMTKQDMAANDSPAAHVG